MFTFSDVESCLTSLVGFRNHRSNEYPAYDSSILVTSSNGKKPIYHPLINVENLDLVITEFNRYDYPDWLNATPYSFDQRVYGSNGSVYKSLVPGTDTNTGNDPISSPSEWGFISNESLYLETLIRDSAEETVNDVVLVKKDRMETKSIFSKLQIYQGSGRINNLVNKSGSLVGFQINLRRSQNLKMIIDKIGAQFDTAQTIRFYLYHSSQNRPIAEFDVDYTKAPSFQWTDWGTELSYFTTNYNAGGAFYLVYDEDQISGQAINYQYDFSSRPCSTCNGYNVGAYNQYYQFFKLSTIKVSAANRQGGDGLDLWDISQTAYVNPTNFGLNMSVTVKCDIGDLICEEDFLFKDIIAQKVIVNLLEHMTNSTRDNDKQTKLYNQALQALNGEPVRAEGSSRVEMIGGEIKKYKEYLNGLNFDLSDLNDVCTPCTKKRGVRYRTISNV